jgi:hypothetical protein
MASPKFIRDEDVGTMVNSWLQSGSGAWISSLFYNLAWLCKAAAPSFLY